MIKKFRPLPFGLLLLLFAVPIWADTVEIDLTANPTLGTPPAPELIFDNIPSLPALTLMVTSPFGGNVTQGSGGLGSDRFDSDALGFGEVLRFQFDPEMYVQYMTLVDVTGGLYVVAVNVPQGSVFAGVIGGNEFQINVNTLASTIDITALFGEFRVGAIGVSTEPFGTTSVPTPEPATLLLFGSGLVAGVAGLRKKLKR